MARYEFQDANVDELAAIRSTKRSELLLQILWYPFPSVGAWMEDDSFGGTHCEHPARPLHTGDPPLTASVGSHERIERLSTTKINTPPID